MELIDSALDQEICAFLCGWDVLEKRAGTDEIIDMNLSPRIVPKSYKDRHEVLQDVERFLSLSEIKAHEYISRKLTAHHNYLRMSLGENIPFELYFEKTMGIKPVIFTEEKIITLREQAEVMLKGIGLDFNSDFRTEMNNRQQRISADAKEIGLFLDRAHKEFYNKINAYLHLDAEFNIDYSMLPEDHQFLAWISGDGKNYKVRFNRKRVGGEGISKMKMLASHELTAHAVQACLLRRKSENNLTPKCVSLITVHEPVQFAFEGLATTLASFYPQEFGQEDNVAITTHIARLNVLVQNNACYRLSCGEAMQDCIRYMGQNSAFKQEEITQRLNFIAANKPLGFSYRQIYGIASEAFVEIQESTKDKNKFIKSIYENYCLPEEIMAQTTRPIESFA